MNSLAAGRTTSTAADPMLRFVPKIYEARIRAQAQALDKTIQVRILIRYSAVLGARKWSRREPNNKDSMTVKDKISQTEDSR